MSIQPVPIDQMVVSTEFVERLNWLVDEMDGDIDNGPKGLVHLHHLLVAFNLRTD